MKKVITEEQKEIICSLADNKKFEDAIIAYGGYLYGQGIIRGAIAATAVCLTAVIVSKVVEAIKECKSKTE